MKRKSSATERDNESKVTQPKETNRPTSDDRAWTDSVTSIHRTVGNQAVKTAVQHSRRYRLTNESESDRDETVSGHSTRTASAQDGSRVTHQATSARTSGSARMQGNTAVQRVVDDRRRPPVQPKLKVGLPDDKYEREADRVAEQVMRMASLEGGTESSDDASAVSVLQRCSVGQGGLHLDDPSCCPDCDETLHPERSGTRRRPVVGRDVEQKIQASKGNGRPLPESTRAFFEPRFGVDFSDVRVHTDPTAHDASRALNARAFTTGRDVFFRNGEYKPRTDSGRELLAHELTHVIQQETDHSGAATDVSTSSTNESVLYRACGPAEVGDVSGCIGQSGEALGERFLFVVNCDDLVAGEEARLASFASHVGSEEIVEIHGFASEEGPAAFNENLSCLRARTAAQILLEAGLHPARIRTLYQHGATPGSRPERRSVVITREAPPQPDVEPEPEPEPEVPVGPRRFRTFRIRMISGGEGGEIGGGGVYTFEIQTKDSGGGSAMYTFAGLGLTAGLPAGGYGPSGWSDFTTTVPMTVNEFEGGGRIAAAGVYPGGGGGYSVLVFYCGDLPRQTVEGFGAGTGVAAGASWFHGWWERRD